MKKQPGCERLPMRTPLGAVPVLVSPIAQPGNFRRQWRRCWWKKLNSLMVEKMEVGRGVFGKARTIFNMGGRNTKHLKVAYRFMVFIAPKGTRTILQIYTDHIF